MKDEKVAHSKPPYRAVLSDSLLTDEGDCILIENDDHAIAEMACPQDLWEVDAAFIVQACNYHDRLKVTLRGIETVYAEYMALRPDPSNRAFWMVTEAVGDARQLLMEIEAEGGGR